jgi:hypothetical protein
MVCWEEVMVAPLGERLRHRELKIFYEALRDAVVEGPPGEAELVGVLGDLPASRHVAAVAVLGDAQGSEGPAALRKILKAPGASRDVRCAAVLALAKRCGQDASADLAQALSSRDGVVKDYAMLGLAGAGDDRAWDQAFARLRKILRRPGPAPGFSLEHLSLQSPIAVAVCYLGRHVDGTAGERSVRLVRELRERWDHLGRAEQEWLAGMWPACAPGGPQVAEVRPPDGAGLESWIRDPLFRPVY